MPLRILCFAATMFLNALGVYLCVKSKMVLTPTDGIVNTISEVFHLRFLQKSPPQPHLHAI